MEYTFSPYAAVYTLPPYALSLVDRNYLEIHLLRPPNDRDGGGGPNHVRRQQPVQIVDAAHRLAGEAHDDVALPHRSEEHTSELQSRLHLVCRLLLEKKKKNT